MTPAHPGQRPGTSRLRRTSYAGTVIWSRKPKPAPKPRELERKVQAWGNRMARSMEQSPEKTLQESQDVLKWSRRKNGPDSPFTIKAMNEVANQLSRQNRISEETTLREEIVDGLRKNVGAEDDATLNAEFKLATCLIALERPHDADPLLMHVVAGRSLALGADDPQTLAAKAWSASVAKRVGRLPEARALQEEVVNGYESHGEGESDQGQLAVLNLASTLIELDQLDDAGRLVRSVLHVRRHALGPDDPKTQEVEQILASIEARSE
jgi:Tetratricopeptide repeat